MNRKITSILAVLVLILAFLPSCSVFQVASVAYDIEYSAKFEPIEIPKEYKKKFSSCRGFDFGRSFPGKDNRPFSVDYDFREHGLTNKDGLHFSFNKKGPGFINVFYRDMEHTNKEKNILQHTKVWRRSLTESTRVR